MSGDRPLPPPSPPPPSPLPPPGYVGFEGGHHAELNRVVSAARWTTILTAVAGVAGLGSTILAAYVSVRAQEFLDGDIGEDAFLDTNALAPIGQVIGGVPMLAAAVFTMIWMYRVATNLRTLRRRTSFSPVFAIVGWFLPPFLFVLPLLILRELWRASDPDVAPGDDGWRRSREFPMLYVWFVLYGVLPAILTVVGIGAISDAMFNFDTDAESLAEVASATGPVQAVASGVLGLLAAAAWVFVVRGLTDRHTALTGER